MDMNYTADELAFRAEVRAFLAAELPASIVHKVKEDRHVDADDMVYWQNKLSARGWLALHWPKAYGGTGWGPVYKHIFDEECAEAGAPHVVPFGVSMVAPVIIKFGTQAQKDYYLPRILNNEDWWAQGYSEPGAGSDLAGLNTRAVRDGKHYIVNGQKTWSTLAQHANMMFCLVRTDPDVKKQEGISFLLVDLQSPGITMRPLILLDGAHEVNEVFFDDVKVPVKNLVGEENKGWTCAKYLLTFERTGIADIGGSKAAFRRLKQIAREQKANGRPLLEDPHFARKMADVEMELMALETMNLRTVAAAASGTPGAESSFLKVMGTELRQEISDLFRRAAGPYAMPFIEEQLEANSDGANVDEQPVGPGFAGTVAAQYFNLRKLSIFGGSNEIQKNIIAKAILGL